MAKYASLVEETTATTGTGDIVLAGATAGHRTLAAAFSANDYVNYLIKDAGGGWERGYGKFNGTTGLTRDFVVESSNADAKITLTTGTHTVTIAAHPGMAEYHGYTLELGTNQSLSAAVVETVEWQTEVEDTDGVISVPETLYLPVPLWVDRVKVSGYFGFSVSTFKYATCVGPDNSAIDGCANHNGYGDNLRINYHSGSVIPVLDGSNYGIKFRVYSGLAATLYSWSWAQVEFVQ